jgi:L-amino acid N-acyltransferase YncA
MRARLVKYDTYFSRYLSGLPSQQTIRSFSHSLGQQIMTSNYTIRPATPEDIPAVNAIHRHYVENTVITFIEEPLSDEAALSTFNQITDSGRPYIVATDSDDTVVGYCYVSPFRGKSGYRHTQELSLFCHQNHVRKGIGRQLLARMVEILEQPKNWKDWLKGSFLIETKPHQLMACMSVDTDGPGNGWKLRDFYVQMGFEQKGVLKAVGRKFDKWIE